MLFAVTNRLPASAVAMLREAGKVRSDERETAIPRPDLLALVAGADAVLTLLGDRVDAELLEAAGPQLRCVANVAVGYDNVDVEACRRRGVVVTNTPGVLVDATADLAFALLLGVTRRVREGDALLRDRTPWTWSMSFMLGTGLQGRRLGVVGYGRIGQAVARRALAFGMSVAYTARHEVTEPGAPPAERLPLGELLATSGVVSLHCPLTPETRHLLDRDALRSMRPDAFLVNTSRGPVVDEAALAEALREGWIAGAGLDVFEHEPAVHPGLLDAPNVLLTPHLGSATHETREAMGMLCVEALRAVLLEGQTPPNAVA